ncbi:MAG: hypothetical protein KC635_20815 [Myxococcales bacterium]|nr:hypothetical protein [Myxococcales bacterium]MCB9737315.1 hypothetical protein [Deltaproteobacteria bacterium]
MKTRSPMLSPRAASRLLAALALAAVLGAASAASAVPRQLTVQGYLSDTAGTPVTGEYTLLLSLYASRTAPTSFWDESHTLSVVDGIFDAALGSDVVNPLTVEDFAGHDEVWLGVTVLDGPGVASGGESEVPRKQLSATSYAFVAGFAATADTATHATTADSAATATTATTATSAQGLTCSGCVQLAQLGFDPATQAELQSALAALAIPTSVNGLGGGTISSGVTVQGSITASSYALAGGGTLCTSSGNCGATLAALSCVAPASVPKYVGGAWVCADVSGGSASTANDLTCTGCVSEAELGFDPVTAGELATALQGYVTAVDVASTLTGYVTVGALGDALSGYLTGAETEALLGDYARLADLPTSVDGLAGGTITSDVTVNGALDAAVVRQDGHIVCDETGNCGPTLADVTCTPGQVLQYVDDGGGGRWACGPAAIDTPPVCAGAYKSLQWDGATWSCVDVRASGLSGGKARGFEVIDAWGYAWDGQMRPLRTWALAEADCESDGGRLPTVTELWRVNATTGDGGVGDGLESNWHWAITPLYAGDRYMVARIDTGAVSWSSNASSENRYRCVWPDHHSEAFDGNNCFGPPGEECFGTTAQGARYNIDASDRPAVPWWVAANECAFYNARLPMPGRLVEAIQTGLPNGSGANVWTGDGGGYNTTNFLIETFNWSGTQDGSYDASYAAGHSTWNYNTASYSYNFRCIGLNYDPPASLATVTDPWTDEQARLKTTVVDGPVGTWAAALDACYAQGGHLGRLADWTRLVQNGLPRGTPAASYIWTADGEEGSQGSPNWAAVLRWTGTAPDFTTVWNTWRTWDPRTTSTYAARCVWYPVDETYTGPTDETCNGGCYTVDRTIGVASQKVWVDKFDRSPLSISAAIKTCYELGGHLPRFSELAELIRAGLLNGSNALNWTSDWVRYEYAMGVQWTAAAGTAWDATSGTGRLETKASVTAPFRCVWTNELID